MAEAKATEKVTAVVEQLPQIVQAVGYDEIFGQRINDAALEYVDVPVRDAILYKFLKANDFNVEETVERLKDTLRWRKEFQPLSAAFSESFDPELEKLGVIHYLPSTKLDNYKVGTWNLYGNVKSPQKLFSQFGDDDTKKPGTVFLRWRIGLMERSLLFLDFTDPANSKIVQIHDYKNVLMFRMDKGMKQATKEIISIFGANYPELLSTKFFVNVPSIMSWVFGFFSAIGIISSETLQKFRPLNHGDLTEWFDKAELPKEYSGVLGSVFDLDKAKQAQPSKYAQVLLLRAEVQNNNLSVE